jgi:hypothetical protein
MLGHFNNETSHMFKSRFDGKEIDFTSGCEKEQIYIDAHTGTEEFVDTFEI